MRNHGFETDSHEFKCIDWEADGASLTVGDVRFEVFPSPYALGCRVRSPLAVVSSIEELKTTSIAGHIVLLRGEIAKEQIMPKNFPFYNPESHRMIIELLESGRPEAIITATSRDPAMVGGQYPFPLFEDGDFDIPSVYCTDVEGERLVRYADKQIDLVSRTRRIPSTGCNVIARHRAGADRRIVLVAHIDSRIGTPGANDNASGVVVLLLLAEHLEDYAGNTGIEIVAMNGEDYFSNPGEQQYLAMNQDRLGEIVLAINLDDVGYHKGKVAYSLYECPDQITRLVDDVFSEQKRIVPGESWVQGDHSLFVMNGRPALALTTDRIAEAMAEITHTPKDTIETVNRQNLVSAARALHALLKGFDDADQGDERG
jgi:aminopeptidase YwaD